MTDNEIADNITRTAEYIDEHGFCQGRAQDADGRVCILGGVRRTIFDTSMVATRNYIANFLRDLGELAWHDGISEWNDAPGRTKFDVVNMLQKCAESARA